MAHRELYSSLNPGKVAVVAPILGNNTTEGGGSGTGFSMKGYNSCLILYQFGISGDTLSGSVFVQAVLEHADDNGSGAAGTYAAVPAASIVGTLPLVDDPAEDPAIHAVAYLGGKEWVRPSMAFTGTHTNGIPIAITALRGHKGDLNR